MGRRAASSITLAAFICLFLIEGSLGRVLPAADELQAHGRTLSHRGRHRGGRFGETLPWNATEVEQWFEDLELWYNETAATLASCTTPLDLLQQDEAKFGTFAELIANLSLTEAFSRPNYMGATRALTEDFWAAWLAASNATALPNLAEYSRMELWRLCRAVHSLLAPDLEALLGGPPSIYMEDFLTLGPSNEMELLEVKCPNATLVEVDTPVEGSAGCRLEDCLACAGLDGCACVDCMCVCAL